MSILEKIQGAVRTASPDRVRCATPLRPSAGLVGRIPAASHEDDGGENSFEDIPFTASGSTKPQRPPQQRQGLPTGKGVPPANNKGQQSTTIEAAALQNFTLHESPNEDAYSVHEKKVVSEVNLLRGDPNGYAFLVERDATVARPFVPAPMTLGALVRYSDELQIQRDAAQEKLDDLLNQKKKEVATIHAEWVAEDLDKAKKAKKGAPKKGATPDPDMDPERLEAMQQLEKRYASLQRDLAKSLETSSQAHSGATQGIKVLRDCVTKLRAFSSVALPSLLYNRGLSLAARELCSSGTPAAHHTSSELKELGKQFGEVGERVAVAQHLGVASIRQTVMEMLLGVQEAAKKSSRNALLDPGMLFVGCGWRKQRTNTAAAATTLLMTSGFEELDAIYTRPHMPLDGVRRMLPSSSRGHPTDASTSGGGASNVDVRIAALAAAANLASTTSPTAMHHNGQAEATTATSSRPSASVGHSTIIKLQTHLDVSLISPMCHPMVCGNDATVTLRVGTDDVRICASLIAETDPLPTTPVSGAGDVFVQHTSIDEGVVEVRLVLPSRGCFRLVLFANSSKQPSAPFKNIGSIRLLSSKWHSSNIRQPFPLVTSDFSDRRCTLFGPLEGQLQAGCLYTFELVVPLTSYLQRDIERIDQTLQATMTRYGVARDETRHNDSLQGTQEEDVDNDHGNAKDDDDNRPHPVENEIESAPAPAPSASATVATPPSPLALIEQELEEAKEEVDAAKKRVAEESPVIANDIAIQTRELGKKKGKEQDRVKAQIQEWEEMLAQLAAGVQRAEARVVELQEKMVNQRRAQKRANAQILRFQREKEKFEEAADRRAPLRVQLSLEERRADFVPIDHEYTVYRLETRMPREAGPVAVFINGLAVVMYTVVE